MPTVYFSKDEMKMLHSLVSDRVNLGGDYSDEESELMEKLYYKTYRKN